MPTEFLKARHKTFFAEVSGRETVQYTAFDPATVDTLTGEVLDEAAAYAATPINLPGLVQFTPSQSVRERIGLEVDFEAVIRIPARTLTDFEITLKVGDRFTLPDGREYYAKKVVQNMQAGGEFLEYLVAVGAKVGRRG